MKSHPILMSAPMMLAYIAGRKTQTRRIITPQPTWESPEECLDMHGEPEQRGERSGLWSEGGDPENMLIRCPYGTVGDMLWMREAWRLPARWDDNSAGYLSQTFGLDAVRNFPIRYEADETTHNADHAGFVWGRYRHARFMPQWASRFDLPVQDVRVEPLLAISKEDAIAEGVEPCEFQGQTYWKNYEFVSPHKPHCNRQQYFGWPVDSYASLWRSINGPDSWDLNPWVWAITFPQYKEAVS